MDKFNEFLKNNNQKGRQDSSLDLISNNIRRLFIKCYGQEPSDISQISLLSSN